MPSPPLLCAIWAASLSVTVAWQHLFGGADSVDALCVVVAHAAALPVLLACAKYPTLLPMLGCSVMGLCMGMCLIDATFDLLVLRADGSHDAARRVAARRVAHGYYHGMLNGPIVNGTLLLCLLLMSFGAWLGAADALATDDAHARRTWASIVLAALCGIPLYLAVVVPRYLGLRASAAFDAAAFDGWGLVLFARVVLMACMGVASSLCMRLILMRGRGLKGADWS